MTEQFSPARLFATLVVIIFLTEVTVMVLLPIWLPHDVHGLAEAVLDAAILTLVTSAFLWRLFVRPLRLALLSRQAEAAAIMNTTSDGIITIDAGGVIRGFNRAAENMFGYAENEALGSGVSRLMPEPHAREHSAHIANYIRTGQGKVIGKVREVPALRKDGTVFPIELTVTELKLGGKRSFTGIIRDITERKRAHEQLQRLAEYDALTGLPNRVLFYDRLRQAMALARRNRRVLALLYLDLDRFKAVNDTLGHDAGDELLKSVGERVQRLVRESDTVARMGGDEFIVILPEIQAREDAGRLAGKIIEALAAPFELHPAEQPRQEVAIGCTVGIALYPGDAQDIDGLIKAADAAMYQGKKARNTYQFHQR